MKLSNVIKWVQIKEKIGKKFYIVGREITKENPEGKILDKILYNKESERDNKEYFKNNYTYNRNLSKKRLSHVWETTAKNGTHNPRSNYKYQYSVTFNYEKKEYIARSSLGLKGDGNDNVLKMEAQDKAYQLISGAVLNNSSADFDDIEAIVQFNKINFITKKITYVRHT